ncbi:MAG: hypothetical protein OEV89_08550 [Desulfobulbaceae bacterium]|nr:hypothetical protein [Desulfobulbaceae bacterium]
MLDELAGHVSFFQVLSLNTVGRLVERRFADWLEALFICLSWPDSRVWCNQTGSLAGTMQVSPVAGVCAGILSSDSRMYGPGCMTAACDFIINALRQTGCGSSAEEIVGLCSMASPDTPPKVAGYARPVATGDERIDAMVRVGEMLGVTTGKHLVLAGEIEKFMKARWGETMNLAGYSAAVFADHGFSSQETYRLLSCWVNSGIHACYAEAADQPPESFFPLHCEDIDYQGKAARPVPACERS